MPFLKKLWLLLLSAATLFWGVWLVLVNSEPVSAHFLMFAVSDIPLGLLLVLTFVVGTVLGVLVGLNVLSWLRLNVRLANLKREVRLLQEALGKRRSL